MTSSQPGAPPGHDGGPRRETRAASVGTAAGSTTENRLPAQLRRRQEAARRLPTLDCGDRDPLLCVLHDGAGGEDLGGHLQPASFCCAALGLEQVGALARLGRYCTTTICARLPLVAS